MYERVRASYDRVAERYADELGGELSGKPLDRALLRCLVDLVADAGSDRTTVADSGSDRTVDTGSVRTAIADLGCGPGHVADHLAELGVPAIGIDISPAMVEVGRKRYPRVQFRVGSLLALPATDGELAAAVAFYSIIHLEPVDRPAAYAEMRRVLTPGGWLLLGFHVSRVGEEPGEIMHVEQWWGEQVDFDMYYLDPAEVADGLAAAGFVVMARTDREPWPGVEHQSRRCYLLCRRS